MLLKCIKPTCPNKYETDDPDPYYCPSCLEIKKSVSALIDQKFASIPREHPKSELKEFDDLRKRTGVNFPNIRDLGITL